MKNFIKKNYLLIICIIIQTIVYIVIGTKKEYLHIDEAYSFGLANYEGIEIQDNDDFYDNWHTKDYYEDYLTIQNEEIWDFKPVYENQKNDVHPPLYYLLLKLCMNCSVDKFTKWTGISLNIVIYAFVTVFMYLILNKIFKNEKYMKEKSVILAFVSSITLASISNAIYIRMYSLLTLEILITIFLHIKLLENKKCNVKLLMVIGITVLLGILTHYYYLWYLVALYLVFTINCIIRKQKQMAIRYTVTIFISGILSLVIFPYSIQHMFFGYRGQGVIDNFQNVTGMLKKVVDTIHNLNYYAFNGLMYLVILIIIGAFIYSKLLKKELLSIDKEKKEILKMIYIPSLFFLIVSAIASPWQVLRYIVPVCGLIFMIVIYYMYKLLQKIFKEKIVNRFVFIILSVIIISPFIFDLKPELLYTDKKEIVEKLSVDLNVPTVYFIDSQSSILDDILLFSEINESYITKTMDFSNEKLEGIFLNKDISNGIVIFIGKNQDEEFILKMIKQVTHLETVNYLKELGSSNVYYINK